MKSFLLATLVLGQLVSAAGLEQPVGFVSEAHGGLITPLGLKTGIPAKAGDFLFPGDVLSGAPGSISFYFCSETGAGRRIQLVKQIVLSDQFPNAAGEAVDICAMPKVERWPSVAVLPDVSKMMAARDGLDGRMQDASLAQRKDLEALSHRDLSDPRVKLSFATRLQEAGLLQEAAWQYRDLSGVWPAQPRLKKLVFDLVQQHAGTREIVHPEEKSKTSPVAGKTYALVIGISKYEQKAVPDLRFAANDANEFAAYLRTARGGATEVLQLIDGQATSGAIRQSFNALYRKAGPGDAVVLLVAAHGDMDGVRKIPIVITHRANPQDLNINSFPMSEIQQWMLGKKAPFGRAIVFLDVCHAGHLAEFQTAGGTTKTSLEYFGLLATHSGPDAFAFESDLLGNGHGAFSYFLLRGLNTQEAKDPDGPFITLADLTNYVTQNVSFVTRNKQLPTSFLGSPLDTRVADLTKTGLNPFETPAISQLRLPLDSLRVPRGRNRPPAKPQATGTPGYPPELAQTIDIENRGEDVLLRYLQGDEVAQNEQEFRDCRDSFHILLSAEPGSPYLAAREDFCEGRAEVFRASREKSAAARAQAAELLEEAIRLDPGAAYPYNALGILWLEQGQYRQARGAFEDAITWAPHWAYPRHNLALALFQEGDYHGSVQTYKAAMAETPDLFYLPYGLGLVYQRMNLLDEAEESYRQALHVASSRPEPYTAIGSIHALRGEWRQAETYYRRALAQPDPLPVAAQAARHDLALVLARKSSGAAEALRLWKENDGYLPSQVSAAEFLEEQARKRHWRDAPANAAAIEAYRTVQGHLGLEKLGDLLMLANRRDQACTAYEQAVSTNQSAPALARLANKKKTCAQP